MRYTSGVLYLSDAFFKWLYLYLQNYFLNFFFVILVFLFSIKYNQRTLATNIYNCQTSHNHSMKYYISYQLPVLWLLVRGAN